MMGVGHFVTGVGSTSQEREPDLERASLAELGVYPDRAAELLDDLLADVQTQPEPRARGTRAPGSPVKSIEQLAEHRRVHALAVIDDLQAGEPILDRETHGDGSGAVVGDGVVEEV